MDLLEAQAFWTLGMLPREKIPAIAQDALEQGLDDPSLRILAGLNRGELDEAVSLFEKILNSMGYRKLSKQEALDICADYLSRQILDGTITPYDGAKQFSVLPFRWKDGTMTSIHLSMRLMSMRTGRKIGHSLKWRS